MTLRKERQEHLAHPEVDQGETLPVRFWVATTSGDIAINGTKNIPVYLDFADAASNPPAVHRRELHSADGVPLEREGKTLMTGAAWPLA